MEKCLKAQSSLNIQIHDNGKRRANGLWINCTKLHSLNSGRANDRNSSLGNDNIWDTAIALYLQVKSASLCRIDTTEHNPAQGMSKVNVNFIYLFSFFFSVPCFSQVSEMKMHRRTLIYPRWLLVLSTNYYIMFWFLR